MKIQMTTTIVSTVDTDTLDTEHRVLVDAGEASVLGRKGVVAIAITGLRSGLNAILEQERGTPAAVPAPSPN